MPKKRNRKVWITLVALVVVAAGAYAAWRFYPQTQAQASTEPEMQTAVARRGDMVIYASGAGSVVPASEISIGFDESGTLTELLVQVGEEVKAGQVLARLQTKDTQASIDAEVASAELSVMTAQQTLDELYTNAAAQRAAAMQSVATYAQEVKDAQYQLDNYNIPADQAPMAPMEAVATIGEKLDQARAAFEPYKYYDYDNTTRQDLKETLDTVQAEYNSAIKRLEYEYELEVAKLNLEQAMQEYDRLKDGPAADDLAIAQAQLANAQADLALAKEQQPVEALLAPIDGTILSIDAALGEPLNGSAFITLADLSRPLVEVYLDETDLDHVVSGYEAEVIFDALPDDTFSGQVVEVKPTLETVSNVTTVVCLVQLDESYAKQHNLPVGLNASVDVIGGRATNAVLVPIEALREIGPDEYAVFVVQDGQPRLRTVSVGLMDLTSAEITSGLEAGEEVSTGVVATTSGQ